MRLSWSMAGKASARLSVLKRTLSCRLTSGALLLTASRPSTARPWYAYGAAFRPRQGGGTLISTRWPAPRYWQLWMSMSLSIYDPLLSFWQARSLAISKPASALTWPIFLTCSLRRRPYQLRSLLHPHRPHPVNAASGRLRVRHPRIFLPRSLWRTRLRRNLRGIELWKGLEHFGRQLATALASTPSIRSFLLPIWACLFKFY